LLIVLLLAALYGSVADSAYAQGALRGMGAVAAGLITATGIKLVSALDKNPMGLSVCIALAALTFVAIAVLHWPLVWVLLGLGGAACVWAFRALGQVRARGAS
jgi:chromate transporter